MMIPTILSSKSSSEISEKMRCEIEYKSSRKCMISFYKDFESKNILHMSNVTFLLEPCKSAMKTCKQIRFRFYKRSNSSNSVNCTKEIDFLKKTK